MFPLQNFRCYPKTRLQKLAEQCLVSIYFFLTSSDCFIRFCNTSQNVNHSAAESKILTKGNFDIFRILQLMKTMRRQRLRSTIGKVGIRQEEKMGKRAG